MTESSNYVTVTESDEKRIQWQKALSAEGVVRRLYYTDRERRGVIGYTNRDDDVM